MIINACHRDQALLQHLISEINRLTVFLVVLLKEYGGMYLHANHGRQPGVLMPEIMLKEN